jgi:UDPglucose--hexose-1-phosphate uridylyltransferase
MSSARLQLVPHRRFNPLTQEWVLVSPHRAQRPWLGKVEERAPAGQPSYDPACYLCPDNERAEGARNPQYASTFAFDNDFPALLRDAPAIEIEEAELIVARSEPGICRVLCFSPRHDLTIARMKTEAIREVVDCWARETTALGAIPWINHVQIFENRGALMGASNPHPHCQIWATATLPTEPAKELESFKRYNAERNSCLLCDYLRLEIERGERVVCQNKSFAVIVPYWAVWPFETLLMSKRHVQDLAQLSAAERADLGDILHRTVCRYDNLFDTPFPYSMGFHQRPTDQQPHDELHLHAHYYPPLLRSATVQKFMVGFELLGTPQRDLTPESAAERLRQASETHYLDVEQDTIVLE